MQYVILKHLSIFDLALSGVKGLSNHAALLYLADPDGSLKMKMQSALSLVMKVVGTGVHQVFHSRFLSAPHGSQPAQASGAPQMTSL